MRKAIGAASEVDLQEVKKESEKEYEKCLEDPECYKFRYLFESMSDDEQQVSLYSSSQELSDQYSSTNIDEILENELANFNSNNSNFHTSKCSCSRLYSRMWNRSRNIHPRFRSRSFMYCL